jgi:hypothetical protein
MGANVRSCFWEIKCAFGPEPNFPIVVDCFSLQAAAVSAYLPLQEPKQVKGEHKSGILFAVQ